MQVWVPERQRFDQAKWFLWMRITVGALLAVVGLIQARAEFSNIAQWVESISLAIFLLIFRVRQPGESPRVLFTNVRVLLTHLSALAVGISAAWFLAHRAR